MSFHPVRVLLLAALLLNFAGCGESSQERPAAPGENAAAGTKASPSASSAPEMPELARKKNCLVCHAIDKKVIGPAWRDVAKKYKDDPGARERLIAKTIKGGGGVWGAMPMPPTPGTSEAEAGALVDFVLGLAK